MEGLSNRRRVLVVDDGSILLGALGAAIGDRGYEVLAVALDNDSQTLLAAINHYRPDVVLLNHCMLTQKSCRLGRWFRRKAPKFLALRQGDQPTNAVELRRSLRRPVTFCTPADLPALLP